MRTVRPILLAAFTPFALTFAPVNASAAQQPGAPAGARPESSRDPMQEGLPLRPGRTLQYTARAGNWMSVDVSPDGQTLVFDHLGDLYTMPIAGGKATPLTRGIGFDNQPRFSPDGKRVVFVSDRDGGWNVWHIALDKKDTVQVTRGKTADYFSPEWTPDGTYIVVTRDTKLHLYHKDGGSGQQLIREPQPLRTMGAAVSPDGRYIWHAQRTGRWTYNTTLADYQLAVYDRETGTATVRTQKWGSAFRPTLSPDGKWLVYASRSVDQTGLRLRDLQSGEERWLVIPVHRDDQESMATLDAYPGMSFTPDSRALIAYWSGKLWNVPIADGSRPQEIPFEVDVHQAIGPEVKFEYRVDDSPTFTVKQIRDAVASPDGKRLAFVAMDRLYVMDYPAGTPRRVTTANTGEYEPAWSPDGQWIVYASWSGAEGGHLYKVRPDASGRSQPLRLTTIAALYTEPVFSPDGRRIVAMRGAARAFTEALSGGIPFGAEDFIWVPATGGGATFIAPTGGLSTPHFTRDSTRIYAYGNSRGLVSFRWDGTDDKTHVRVLAPPQPDAPPPQPGQTAGTPASVVIMAPQGDQALAQVVNDLYVVTVPLVGGQEPRITLGDNTAFPVRKLTEIGGQFAGWEADAKKVHWSIGNAHFVYDLDRARAFDDSVRLARGGGRQAGADSTRADSAARRDSASVGNPPAPSRRPSAAYQPAETRIRITAERDTPRGSVVLRGARVITMRGDEVIENADVLVTDNRIVRVGQRAPLPAGARLIDVTGNTISPGFVDTHAHVRAVFGIHREQVWSYAANLAFGVTTLRDPQTATTDVLSYEDQVTAGRIIGPRIYSTGPGVFSSERVRDLDHARRILKRYSDYYDTKTIKQYVAGNREQRQWLIQAARELKLMPTTEGGLDIRMNYTEAMDGYSGHEHTIPTYPLQEDLLRLYAASGTVYTPTILVAYGGPWAENYWYANYDVFGDKKLRRFTPFSEIEAKALRRGRPSPWQGSGGGWFHENQHIMKVVGEDLKKLVAAGGKIGVGSHGQLQGLGYHWELWSMAMGGLSNHDALRAATSMGAEAIGLGQDVGMLEGGKLADLIVFRSNPLENLRNTSTIRYVMKNGRLYDGETLDEVWPRDRKQDRFYWVAEDDVKNGGKNR